jgi:hypothetical protein
MLLLMLLPLMLLLERPVLVPLAMGPPFAPAPFIS